MVACMTGNLTVAGLLEEAAERLRASIAAREPSATPELDAQLLLAHVLAVPRTRLKSHPEERPHPSRIEEYRRLLARHAAGEPVAYLTGYRHFWSLRLAVTPAVLIPRPETELLVERALALHPAPAGRLAAPAPAPGPPAPPAPRHRRRRRFTRSPSGGPGGARPAARRRARARAPRRGCGRGAPWAGGRGPGSATRPSVAGCSARARSTRSSVSGLGISTAGV